MVLEAGLVMEGSGGCSVIGRPGPRRQIGGGGGSGGRCCCRRRCVMVSVGVVSGGVVSSRVMVMVVGRVVGAETTRSCRDKSKSVNQNNFSKMKFEF